MKTVAIITGASSGIGREFFMTVPEDRQLDEIWVMARNKKNLEALQTFSSRKVVVIDGDLTDNGVIGRLLNKLDEEKPVVKLLINSSGYGKFGKTTDVSMEDSLGMIDLNCKALTAVTHAVLPYMDKGSDIIQIASIAGFTALPYLNVYAATKAYVLSFSRALRGEYKKQGINVLAVCPYWTDTNFFDRAKKPGEDIIKKYFVVYDPKKVVKRAWRDLKKKKAVSSYGAFNRMLVFFMKITPSPFKMWIWKKIQKLD